MRWLALVFLVGCGAVPVPDYGIIAEHGVDLANCDVTAERAHAAALDAGADANVAAQSAYVACKQEAGIR